MNQLTKEQKKEAVAFMNANENAEFAYLAHILSLRFKVDLRSEDCAKLMLESLF